MTEITVTAKLAVEIHEADEGGYWGSVPSLPGCHSQAETREELLENLREAAELYLAAPNPGVRAWRHS
jgi:predicted RNase H-like HicB family nuclease